MADELENSGQSVQGTEGHESEAVNISGLKATLQKFKNDIVDPLMGPTYDSSDESIDFPVTAKASYDSEDESIDFD